MKKCTLPDGTEITVLSHKDKVRMYDRGECKSTYPEIQFNGRTHCTVTLDDEDWLLKYGISEYEKYKNYYSNK